MRPVALSAPADRLHLTRRPSWGMALRRDHLALDAHDLGVIAEAMRPS